MRNERQSLQRKIADAIERLATLARAGEQQAAFDASLSPLQGRVLALLMRHRELRVGAIARQLMVTSGTVSAAISTLAAKNLVTKRRDPTQPRAILVEVTRTGQGPAAGAEHGRSQPIAGAVEALPTAESGALLASLLKLIATLERQGRMAATRMCISCRHFVPHGGTDRQPHYCRLLAAPIGNPDLRVDCPEHTAAAPAQRARALRSVLAGG